MTTKFALRSRGFTAIEVIMVLIIIGILAVLIVNSLQSVQTKARDATRRTEIDNIAASLEDCYNNKNKCNGTYPSLSQLTDTFASGFIASNLPGFNNSWLYDSSAGIIQANTPTAATQYQYDPSPTDCTGAGGSLPCSGFTLRAYQETNTSHPYVKESANK